jgi:hypothetical protein
MVLKVSQLGSCPGAYRNNAANIWMSTIRNDEVTRPNRSPS